MTKYIAHAGIRGMRWNQRNYQNPDGTWTEAGKAKRRAEYKSRKSNSTDSEETVKTGKQSGGFFARRKAKREQEETNFWEERQRILDERNAKRQAELDAAIEEETRRADEYREKQKQVLADLLVKKQIEEAQTAITTARVNAELKLRDLQPKVEPSFIDKYIAPALGEGVKAVVTDSVKSLGKKYIIDNVAKKVDDGKVDVTYSTIKEYDDSGNLKSHKETTNYKKKELK